MTTPGYEGWAIVELMGHVRIAGLVSEVTQYGAAMGRIDIPGADGEPLATQFFGGASVYRITPVSEEVARAVAAANRPEPVHHWELPAPRQHNVEEGAYRPLSQPGSGQYRPEYEPDDDGPDEEVFFG